ncbi:hypothetical protein ZIOFF_021044 [Zingiber officinale]|uniref:DUF8040 domain-containing protein n=1 Tax=Zingiber officinale TaxID=94328 RepID=A0A8J5H0X7_ZINOF|nr:hypothetical protein ZIOFF_021044 [Zingiber officinale]
MDRRTFRILCDMVQDVGGLKATKNATIDEIVALFVYMLAHYKKNQMMSFLFKRSRETMSRHFNLCLRAILQLHNILLKKLEPIRDDYEEDRWKPFKMVYGKDRATSLVAEDSMMAAQNINDVDAGLTISDDNSLAKKGVEVKGFMQTVSSQFESMSSWVQGKSSKIPQVLEMLDKYDFVGKNKYKVVQVICEDPVKVELLFSLDPSEVEDFILSCLE